MEPGRYAAAIMQGMPKEHLALFIRQLKRTRKAGIVFSLNGWHDWVPRKQALAMAEAFMLERKCGAVAERPKAGGRDT